MADNKKDAPRPEEGILDTMDDALADSFPASDPPSQSSPTTPTLPTGSDEQESAQNSKNKK